MSGFSANPDRDTAFRDRGRVVAIALKNLARDMLTHPDAMLQLRGYGYAQARLHLSEDIMQYVGLPAIDVPVRLVAIDEDSNAAALYIPGRTSGGVGRIVLPILPNADWSGIYRAFHSGNPGLVAAANRHLNAFHEQIDSWFEHRQAYIVHEMTHMFDFLRRKDDPKITSSAQGYAAYVNSALELNAHFQEMLAEVEEAIPKLPYMIQDAVVGDFNIFWREIRKTRTYRQAWPQLTPKNQRKFVARAAQYWQSIQPQGSPKKAIPFPDTRQAEQVFVSREAPREHIFDRLQREISERRRRR
jgi:hypothetical protein